MKNLNSIDELVQLALNNLKSQGYNELTIQAYESSYFNPILKRYSDLNQINYSQEIMDSLLKLYLSQLQNKIISRTTYNKRVRGVLMITELNDFGSFKWKVFTFKDEIPISSGFKMTIKEYLKNRDVSIRTLQFEERILYLFSNFLNNHDILQPKLISTSDIVEFIKIISKDNPKSMDRILTCLKKYLVNLYRNKKIDFDISSIVSFGKIRDRALYPPIDMIDLVGILNSIDRETPTGKRNYAIIILGAMTGLRAGDIVRIQLEDIDWKKRKLNIVQGKTNSPISVPLTESVCNAIADYILNGRPKTDDNSIFIRSIAPFTGLKDGCSIASFFRRYLLKAGIEPSLKTGNTFHSIRRMFGTQLIINGVPVTMIAQLLGHQSVIPTKQYISLDVEGLRKCALSMETLDGRL